MGPSRNVSPSRGGASPSSPRWVDEDFIDDVTVGLYIQQFLDEWHYRALHSGLALNCDRTETIVKALDVFEAAGVELAHEEKLVMAEMDEDDMIQAVVAKMPPAVRKGIEPFCLQLQLVLSTATRVRNVLEEGTDDEITAVMEDNDGGVSQQILKEVIVEAGREVSDVLDINGSWSKTMDMRASRLIDCAMNAEFMENELKRVEMALQVFRPNQNPKAMKAVHALCVTQDQSLKRLVLVNWLTWLVQYQSEKAIHQKYQDEIEAVKLELAEYQKETRNNVYGLLCKQLAETDFEMLAEAFQLWAQTSGHQKTERETELAVTQASQRLDTLKAEQKATIKSSLQRFAMSSESGLRLLAFQAWYAHLTSRAGEREAEFQIKAAERQLAEMKKSSVETVKSVCARIVVESDAGVLGMTLGVWREEVCRGKMQREAEVVLEADRQALVEASKRQRGNATFNMERINRINDENLLMNVVMNWAGEVRLSRVIRHYSGKMDTKQQQLEAVQHMFKSFAAQLEQGIGSTPRSQRKSVRGTPAEGGARPPQLPP